MHVNVSRFHGSAAITGCVHTNVKIMYVLVFRRKHGKM